MPLASRGDMRKRRLSLAAAAGRTMPTDSATSTRDPNETRAFSDLEIGQRVHVKDASGTWR